MDEFSDEMLMAYADHELDPDAASRIATAIEVSPALMTRYLAFARTGRKLSEPFAPMLDEKVPAALMAMIAAPSRAPDRSRSSAATQKPFIAAALDWISEKMIPQAGWQWAGAAYAAVLLAGLGAGALVQNGGGDATGATGAMTTAGLRADGELAAVLEGARSGEEVIGGTGGARMSARLTFKTAAGGYCRQYTVAPARGGGFEGVACRDEGGWIIRAFAPGAATAVPGGATVPAAGAGSPLVEAVVDGLIAGDVLTADDEAQALAAKWSSAKP